jgi:hypothetical protein
MEFCVGSENKVLYYESIYVLGSSLIWILDVSNSDYLFGNFYVCLLEENNNKYSKLEFKTGLTF